jgi:hypothetical protein
MKLQTTGKIRKWKRQFAQERKEHPSFTKAQVEQIVKDHSIEVAKEKTEKDYKDFSQKAKDGFNRFQNYSGKEMALWFDYFKERTGKLATYIHNKEEFYEFVAENEIAFAFKYKGDKK